MEYLSNKSNCTNKPNIPIDITSNNDNNIDDKTLSVLISFKIRFKASFQKYFINQKCSQHALSAIKFFWYFSSPFYTF